MRVLLFFLLFSALGSKAQHIPLISSHDLEMRLNNGKDSTFVINFWATWCVPCVKELPGFEKLQHEFSGQKLKVILLSVDNKSKANSAVRAFIRKHKLTNEVFVANEQKPQDFIFKMEGSWTGSLPATLIVNRQKNIRQFYEQQFTYSQLVKIYPLTNK